MSDLYVSMYKHARLGGSGACSPRRFLKLNALRLLLRQLCDRSRAVVAAWRAEYWIQFLAAMYMHLLSTLTLNFHERRY